MSAPVENNNEETIYERVRITAKLCCESDLHIGSGISCYLELKQRSGKNIETEYDDICLDSDNKPYIPASTIRGCLARLLKEIGGANQAYIRTLLGEAHRKGSDIGMGELRVYDALYDNSDDKNDDKEKSVRLITRTSINPVTGTSEEHKLFNYKVVNAGEKFNLVLELDNVSKSKLSLLLKALNAFDGSEKSQLGKNKSNMMGRMVISVVAIEGMSNNDFIEWLKCDNPFGEGFKEIENILSEFDGSSKYTKYNLYIKPESAFLINDIHQVSSEKSAPSHVCMSKNGKLLIPASTIKGIFRGHCRKILLTMITNQRNENNPSKDTNNLADKIISEIFGDKNKVSSIRVSDAISEEKFIKHQQSFIAIDRFTGGVADGALYSVVSATGVDDIPLTIYIKNELLNNDWIKGLLIFVLRDAVEGDLRVGWGKAKGFGAFTLAYERTDNNQWVNILNDIGKDRAVKYVKELNTYISRLIENTNKNTEEASA